MNTQTIPFKDWLLKERRNRTILWVAALAMVVQFSVFKYFYPFASYIHGDSFVYLETAYHNFSVNTYMVGYSRFLRLFSVFTNSDTALVAFQYLFMQSSILFLLFTLFYFIRPGKFVQYLLLGFMIFNPLLLYMANLVSSDGFFLGLSMGWFAVLLWIIYRPSRNLILWEVGLLFIAFTVRYNALIYPFIAVVAFWLSNLPLRVKLGGILAGFLFCGLFVQYTGGKYQKITGIWQYSPFGGWQMTNNAMYAYRYVDSAKRKPVPAKFRRVDNMIRAYFDSTRDLKKHPEEAWMASTVYMWDPRSPLYQYRNQLFAKDTTASELKKWSSMGPFYKEYGLYLIKQYPWEYIKYFIWPNANKYYAPPVEFLDSYNSGKDFVNPIAQAWFGYKSMKVTTRTKDPDIRVLDFYPILSGIINVLILFGLIFFAMLEGFRVKGPIRTAVLLGGGVWLVNALFTIGASSAALRFQAFPMLLSACYACILVEWLKKMASVKTELGNSGNPELLINA